MFQGIRPGRVLPVLIAALILVLLAGSPAVRPGTARAQQAETPEDLAAGSISATWENLLQHRLEELLKVRSESSRTQAMLPDFSAPLVQALPELEDSFKQLSAIAQVSQDSPADLTVVLERTRRLADRLDSLLAPLQDSGQNLVERVDRLAAMETDAPESASQPMTEFHSELTRTRNQLNSLQSRLTITLAPAQKLRADMQTLMDRLDTAMPTLWKDYYLSPTGSLFDPAGWIDEINRLSGISDILSLRLSTDFPQGVQEWLVVLLRAAVAFLLLGSLLYLARKPASGTREDLRSGLLRLLRHSGRWIALGLALHYAAWSGGKLFQVIATLGTMVLCWGQMNFAWDLRSFCHIDQERVSPLWPMFLPMLVGMALLFFDLFPQLLALIWLVYVAVIPWRLSKRARPKDSLSRGILAGFAVMCWISIALTLFGFARLSILLCMAYTAIAVCVQQDLAILQIGNIVEARLPQQGRAALGGRLLLSLLVPTVLLLATLAPVIWVLAYPGGQYLLRHVAGLGFSIGQVSFNAMQVLSIFIAFYLTRSLITVGMTFINGLKSQGTSLDPSLLGPVRTGYMYVLWALFGLYVLRSLGFSLTSLAVVAGGLSVGVGLGLQNIVQNFISGLAIIFGKVIKEGDVVDVAGFTGAVVKKINIRSTQLETADNATVFVPNNNFLTNTFTNWTYNNRKVRRQIELGVAYGTDLARSLELLRQVAAAHPKVLEAPPPGAYFMEFGPTTQNLALMYWIADWNDGLLTLNDLRLRINQVFAENGIAVSFPMSVDVAITEAPPGAFYPPGKDAAVAGKTSEKDPV